MIPGLSPGIFATIFFIASRSAGVSAENESVSTLQPQLASSDWMYSCSCPIDAEPEGRGPNPTCFATSANARLPSKPPVCSARSEEHTSELQSRLHLVCRLLLEKKK